LVYVQKTRPVCRVVWFAVVASQLLMAHASSAVGQSGPKRISLKGSIAGGGINYFAEDKWAMVKGRVRNDTEGDRVLDNASKKRKR